MLRLLLMRANGQITDKQWAEIESLPAEREVKMADPVFEKVSTSVVAFLKQVEHCGLSVAQMLDLYCMVSGFTVLLVVANMQADAPQPETNANPVD